MSSASYVAGPHRPAQLVSKPLHGDGPALSISPNALIAIAVDRNHVHTRAELAALLTELNELILTHINRGLGRHLETPFGSM